MKYSSENFQIYEIAQARSIPSGRLVRIAVEGPELNEVNFEEIVDVFKEHNRRVNFNNLSPCLSFSFNNFYNRD